MSTGAEPDARWAQDNAVLARIGAVLYAVDTTVPVLLPEDLADLALAAWRREEAGDPAGVADRAESPAHRTLRHRAGTLALIGAAIERQGQRVPGSAVGINLDAWFVGLALEAADDHGLVVGPPPERSTREPRFITVDVDVRAARGKSIDALVTAFAAMGTIQNDHRTDDGRFISFTAGEQHDTIASNLAALAAMIGRLGPSELREWEAATSRVLNVGIEAGREENQPIVALDVSLISMAAALNAGITFTHYPGHDRYARFGHTTIT